jgi:hypothetical protein
LNNARNVDFLESYQNKNSTRELIKDPKNYNEILKSILSKLSPKSSSSFQYVLSILFATTPENKNLWLSIIENTGDSLVNLLTLKNEQTNQNLWLAWLKEQCTRFDALTQDLVNDLEQKIRSMDFSNSNRQQSLISNKDNRVKRRF